MKKTVIIGTGVLLIAALIIVLAIFAPRWSHKGEMKDRIELLLSPDPLAVVVSDPLFDTDDPLYDGREAVLDTESSAALFDKLETALDGGYRYVGSEKIPGGAWDISIVVRTADGKNAQVFFTETGFYYTKDVKAHYFEPKDAAQYAEFLQSVNFCLDAQ